MELNVARVGERQPPIQLAMTGLNGGSSRSPGLMVFVIPAVTKIGFPQKKLRHFFSWWYSLQARFS